MASNVTKPEGFSSIIKYYESGTQEVRYLLDKECEMLYECKWCREIFRSILTFVSHKRSGCRSMFGDLSDEVELAKKFQKRQREERREAAGPSKQGRLNLEAVLEEQIKAVTVTLPHSKKQMELMTLPRNQKSKPLTEFVSGGYQRLVELPTEMAIGSQVPDDRIVVVMPQEKSSRYGEMQLRKRRVDEKYATFTNDQIKILQRIPDDVLTFANIGNLECEHSNCKAYRPFDTFEALAYHLNLTHHSPSEEDGHRCYLCDSKVYNTFDKLKGHLKLKHALVRKNHIDSRKKIPRRGYKRAQENDHRSISPPGYVENDEDEEPESGNASDNGITNSPVTFLGTPIKQEELDIDDPVPVLKRMPTRRGRRQKGRSSAAKPKSVLSRSLLSSINASPKLRQTLESSPSQPTGSAIEFNITNIDEFLNIRPNDTALSNQLHAKKNKPGRTPTKKAPRAVREVSQVSSLDDSEKEEEMEEESREVKINLEELMETDSGEDFNEDGETSIKRRKPVSLIKGRTPRQRNQTSRLNQDFVVPKKFASTTNMLSENQFRAIAKEQAKQMKKDKRKRKRKSNAQSTESSQQFGADSANSLQGEEMDEFREEIPIQKRGSRKRKANKDKDGLGSEDDDFDNATQLLLQQVKNSLAKASTPSGDAQIKQEGSSTASSSTPEPSSQESFILPPLNTAKGVVGSLKDSQGKIRSGSTNASPMKTVFPSIMTGTESELINYSPRTKLHRQNEGVPKVTDETRGEAASRRKQNFTEKKEDNDAASDVKLLQMPGQQPIKPDDLTQLPVTLNNAQRRMLFGPLKPLFTPNREGADGLHQCAECGAVCKTLAEGHKHMVSHVRMVRLKCSLCDAGSFFCTDMRKHLMYRYCANLVYAPPEMLNLGTPCMDAITCDKLIRITSQTEPGRATFTRGMIISSERPNPYFPDPRIEQRLLGSLRASNRASPRKIVLTSRRKSPADDVQQSQPTTEEYSQGDSQPLSQPFNGDEDEGRSSKDSTPPITTNDLLNQTENASAEFLIQHDAEKKDDQTTTNYPLPLTIRANPPVQQKTPSPEPSTSVDKQTQDEVAKKMVVSGGNSSPQQEDLTESSQESSQVVLKPNIPTVPTAVRSPALKPSILSRSPVKAPFAQDPQVHSASSITTPTFQQRSETTLVDTLEQTIAPSSSESSQQTHLTGSEESHGNGDSVPFFLNDQPRIVVSDENP